jgi:hypothetical protein
MPVLYQVLGITDAAVSYGAGQTWYVDSLGDALALSLIGVLLLPAMLHACNGIAWLHARLSRVLLSRKSLGV